MRPLLLAACVVAIAPPALAAPTGTETPPGATLSPQEAANRMVAIGYLETVWNQHDPIRGFALYADPKLLHYPGAPGNGNPEGLARFLKDFPNFRYTIKRVLTDGDYVIVHSLVTGVPGLGAPVTSPQPGVAPAPKTGDEVVDIFRIRDGKIVEQWDVVEPIGGPREDRY